MKNIWTIARREYNFYFSNPAAYIILFSMMLILGIYFYYFDLLGAFLQHYVPPIGRLLGLLATLLMLATPALTARLLAEEHRSGTIELLLTLPVRDSELVVGKWLGACLFMLTVVAMTLAFPFTLNLFVDPGIDLGPVLSGYLAVILLCFALSAAGVAVSSLFTSQVAAFVTTSIFLVLVWWILGPVGQAAGEASSSALVIRYLDWGAHFYDNLLRGILDVPDILFYLSVTLFALVMATLAVEYRRAG
jgi:ABC-2 type transport system permease protein